MGASSSGYRLVPPADGARAATDDLSEGALARLLTVSPLPFLLCLLVLAMGAGAALVLALQWLLRGVASPSPVYVQQLQLSPSSSNELPLLSFHNFSVDSLLPPHRWPQFISPHQPRVFSPLPEPPQPTAEDDPFIAGSPHRFRRVRGAIISLFTPHQTELRSFFPDNDQYLFSHMAEHSDVVLFYTLYPSSAEEELHAELAFLHCQELTVRERLSSRNASSSDIYARLRHPRMRFPQRLEGIREFVSQRGTHVITVPVAVNLPRHVWADPAHLMRADWMGCHGVRRSVEYVLFSGAVFSHQLVFHPILRGYDYFIKYDLDVWWHRVPQPPSLFLSMQAQQCVWMHSFYNGYGTDCGIDAPQAVEDWANRTYGIRPASSAHKWWGSNDYFYGNLLGGWLGWIHSDENRALGDFLYEDPTRPGYFTHRWGDQPPYAKMLGMWFNISDEDIKGKPRTLPDRPAISSVCDFSELRDRDFEHN